VDFVGFAPSVGMQGGPDPESLLKLFPTDGTADPGASASAVAAVAGYFTWQAAQPLSPGIPRVRQFQAAEGEAAMRWLRMRTG